MSDLGTITNKEENGDEIRVDGGWFLIWYLQLYTVSGKFKYWECLSLCLLLSSENLCK